MVTHAGDLKRRRRGFVLLLVLLVLTLAGVLLAGVARAHYRRAMALAETVEDLQLKWALRCCRHAMMNAPELMLVDYGQEPARLLARRTVEVRLGRLALTLLLQDEQVKANVNLLALTRGRQRLGHLLIQLQEGQPRVLPVLLKPAAPSERPQGALPMPFGSYDQLFEVKQPARLFATDGTRYPSDRITCWGTGQLNLQKTELPVLRCMLAGQLDDEKLDKLDRLRKADPRASAGRLLGKLELDKKLLEQLQMQLIDYSMCYSLWIVAEGPGRTAYRFYVSGGPGSGLSEEVVFAW